VGSCRFPSVRHSDNQKIMAQSISDNQKRSRGRPSTGVTPMVGVRLEPDFRAEIEAWAASQEDKPVLAEAIRRLIRCGLGTPKPPAKAPRNTKAV
jgi:hypothetical protein